MSIDDAMINELIDLWVHQTLTPIQAISQLFAYLGFGLGGVGIGWLLRGAAMKRRGRRR